MIMKQRWAHILVYHPMKRLHKNFVIRRIFYIFLIIVFTQKIFLGDPFDVVGPTLLF